MKIANISTYAFNANLRAVTMKTQLAVAQAQKEVVTGQVSDAGLHLGGRTSMAINVDSQVARLDQISATNGLLENRMAAMQTAMSSIVDAGNNLLSQVAAGVDGPTGKKLVADIGRSVLENVSSALNVSYGGEYLFSGVNTDLPAMVEPGTPQGDAALQAVRDAFVAHFGFAADDPAAQGITAAQIDAFIDGPFLDQFDDTNWPALWSGASDRGMRSRISQREISENPVTAQAQAFRSMVAASVLVSEFANSNLGNAATDRLVSRSLEMASSSIGGVADQQSSLGIAEQRVSDANERISAQKDLLKLQRNELTGVDAYEAATRLNELMVGLEASYTVTARLQALSLMNYL